MTVKLTAICILLSCHSYSQSRQDSNTYNTAFADAVAMYHHFAPDQAPVNRGPEYLRKPFPISNGHSYFISDNLSTGSLKYDGVAYDSIPLLYDETSGELITSDYQHSTLISLFNPKIQRFTLF